MKITEIRCHLVNGNSRLRSYIDVIFDDCFIIHEIKILQGKDKPFVVMPDKKITDNCEKCGKPNPLVNEFCGGCGFRIGMVKKEEDNQPLYEDICHSLSQEFRDYLQNTVLDHYQKELLKPKRK